MIKAPKRKMDWEGLKVIANRDLRNGRMSMPAGTPYYVKGNKNGLWLQSEHCDHCRGQQTISHVTEAEVDIADCELNQAIIGFNQKRTIEFRGNQGYGRRRTVVDPPGLAKPSWNMI